MEIALLVLFTGIFIVFATAFAGLVWALGRSAAAAAARPGMRDLVVLSLVGQTIGLALGIGLAWIWLAEQRSLNFWRAIHWHRLRAGQIMAALAGGLVMMIVVQGLGHLLPMPTTTPMDRLFTPQTIWLLAVYGVGFAPFFEEFFFRGLLYPTFKTTFERGITPIELRPWNWLVRLGAVLAGLALLFWYERLRLLGPGGSTQRFEIGAVVLAAFLIIPQLLTWPVRWAINGLARWQHAEFLAIALTGLLFGLMHAAQLGWAWAAVVILVLVGVVLTAVRAASGSLMTSWLMHCAYNATLFVAQYFATQGFHHFPPGLR